MSQKLRKKLNFHQCGPYLVAFIVPIIVMLVVFLERGIWPLGDRCFLRTDLYHQFAPFLKELQHKISTGGSLFYSWNLGGGTNFWALSAYYLASPLNILVFLAPRNLVIEFGTFLIVLRIALSSVTMTYYLNEKLGKTGADRYSAVLIGLLYSLSGYIAAYSWVIMWLDCIVLFPLVILGIERQFLKGRGLLYAVSLGLTLFSNYYIGVMVCFGIFLYCFFLLGTEPKMRENFGKKFLQFLGYTGLGVAFSAVFLLPYIAYFGMTASAGSSFRWEWYSYFSAFDIFSRHLINVSVHTGLEHWPNIFCGVAILLLIPLYLLNRRITLREKIGYAVLILIFYFSFSTRAMDYIWHVFHIPNSLPARYSFIYIFLVLTMMYKGLDGIKDRTYRELALILAFSLLVVYGIEYIQKGNDTYTPYVIYISAVFLVLYTVFFYAVRRGRIYRDFLIILGIVLVAVETCVNLSVTSVSTVSRSQYTDYDKGTEALLEKIHEEDDALFFRAEKAVLRTKNDGAWLSYPSISIFSSVGNNNLTNFYKKLGLEGSTNSYSSSGSTCFTDMILGVKYVFDNRLLSESTSFRSLYATAEGIHTYKNEYVLPLGYMIPADTEEKWETAYLSPLETQNFLASYWGNTSFLFVDVNPDYISSSTVDVTIKESGYYYAYIGKSGPKQVKVITETQTRTFSDLTRGYVINVGYVKAGTTVTFINTESGSTKAISLSLYRTEEDVLRQVYTRLSEEALVLDSFRDTRIEGHINVKEEGKLLLTTIPYEEGWEVTVDGETVTPTVFKDAYLALPLAPGEHTVSFSFHVPYFALGLILTLLSGGVMLVLFLVPYVRKRKVKKEIERLDQALHLSKEALTEEEK